MPLARVHRNEWITKSEFHLRLERWYRDSTDTAVGEPGIDGRTAWVWVRDGHRLAHLNAETTRDAVGDYLALLRRRGGSLEWWIVPSATGQLTKVAFGPDRLTVTGFYLYADPATVPPRL